MKQIKIGTSKNAIGQINILSIPNVWTTSCGGAKVFDTEDYMPGIVNGVFSPYADLSLELIVSDARYPVGNGIFRGVTDVPTLVVSRQNKSLNSAWLNTQASRLGLKNFRFLETCNSDRSFEPTVGKHYIVKPELGARSLGQVIFNPEVTTLSAINNCIAEHTKENLAQQLVQLPGFPVYVSGDENEEHDGCQTLKEQSLFNQEYVPDIDKEFRVIMNHRNEVGYCIERERTVHNDSGKVTVATASGAKRSITTATYCLPPALKAHEAEINQLLSRGSFELYAFDFFTTVSGQWGVFEFAPQCGTGAVPDGFLPREAKLYIERICKTVGLL